MQLICQHCKYEWNYKGEAAYWACCPRCRYSVRVPRKTVGKDGAT